MEESKFLSMQERNLETKFYFVLSRRHHLFFAFKFIVKHFRFSFQNIHRSAFYVNLNRVIRGWTNMLLTLFDDELPIVRDRINDFN